MFIVPEFWLVVIALLLLYNLTEGLLQNLVLLVGSYAIYAFFANFDFRFPGVLLLSTTFFYVLGLIPQHRFRGVLLILGVLFAVGILGYFKYHDFFAATFEQGSNADLANVVLPLGISFYSFRLLSYLFDVYNRRIAPSHSWIDLALYVAFFPQISAGPIERAATFLPRLRTTRRIDGDAFASALIFILVGLFYKLAIADSLVGPTDGAFRTINDLSAPNALSAMILFSIRIYADFAGYSTMAIGVSKLFMLPSMENFRQPYFSRNVVEFWTRWHISLSTWFRDYTFFPLSRFLIRVFGKRASFPVELFSVFMTMLLTGLWHGSNVTYLAWGALHGFYMIVARLIGRLRRRQQDEPARAARWAEAAVGILVTQAAVTIAWVLFAVKSLDQAARFMQRLAVPIGTVEPLWMIRIAVPIAILVIFDLVQAKYRLLTDFWRYPLVWRIAFLMIVAIAIFILGDSPHAAFIYNGF